MAEKLKIGKMKFVLLILGLIACMFLTFKGLVYVFNENIWMPVFLGILMPILLYGLSMALLFFKNKKPNPKNSSLQNRLPEILLGIPYLVLFVISFIFIFHFYDIDVNRNKELKNAGIEKLNELKTLHNEYNNKTNKIIDSYKAKVVKLTDDYIIAVSTRQSHDMIIEAKNTLNSNIYDSVPNSINDVIYYNQFEGKPDDTSMEEKIREQIQSVMNKRATVLKAKYDLGNMETGEKWTVYLDEFFQKSEDCFENWLLNFWNVSYYYYDIDNKYTELYERIMHKMPDFEHKANIESADMQLNSVKYSISHASAGSLGLVLIIVLGIHALIVLPYLTTTKPQAVIGKNTGEYNNNGSVKLNP